MTRTASNSHVVGDLRLILSEPVKGGVEWIGQEELLDQVLACWTRVTENDLPMTPRLIGRPGMGKTTLAQAAGEKVGQEVYIVQCTMDTRPEDLLVTPVVSEKASIAYHASPLVTAMIRGGVAVLDEANRMSEKSWASLAPLFDHRRYVESVVAGLRIAAHREFRCCVTMNDDASTYEVPEYMLSRIQPLITVEFPEREDEMRILRYNVDFAPDDLLALTVDFLQEAHRYNLDYSTRDGINIMRYSLKLRHAGEVEIKDGFQRAVTQILGKGAERFEERAAGLMFQGNLQDLGDMLGGMASPEEGPDEPEGPDELEEDEE